LSSSLSELVTETDSFSLSELVSGAFVVVVVVLLELELAESPSSPTVSSSPQSSFFGGAVGFFEYGGNLMLSGFFFDPLMRSP
jgi:uncharacterized membrane protein YdcZ (DUF606 family)